MNRPNQNETIRTSRKNGAYSIGGDFANYKKPIYCRILREKRRSIAVGRPNNNNNNPLFLSLPATADIFYRDTNEGNTTTTTTTRKNNKKRTVQGWNHLIKTILAGSRDDTSTLAIFRNYESTIIREIYDFIGIQEWAKHVKLTIPASMVGNGHDRYLLSYPYGQRATSDEHVRPHVKNIYPCSSGYDDGFVAFSVCGQVEFPEHQNRNVLMMPFVFGDPNSLPENLQCYYPLIQQCPYMKEEIGRVGYLTVEEGYMGTSPSSWKFLNGPGIRIQPPNLFRKDDPNAAAAAFMPAVEHPWGTGKFFGPDRYEGGIYLAAKTIGYPPIEIRDALIDNRVKGIVGPDGSCDHFRNVLPGNGDGSGVRLKSNELIWMTDCTPIEDISSRACVAGKPFQFFSVVSPYISYWDADRWTPNPTGVMPPKEVTILFTEKKECASTESPPPPKKKKRKKDCTSM